MSEKKSKNEPDIPQWHYECLLRIQALHSPGQKICSLQNFCRALGTNDTARIVAAIDVGESVGPGPDKETKYFQFAKKKCGKTFVDIPPNRSSSVLAPLHLRIPTTCYPDGCQSAVVPQWTGARRRECGGRSLQVYQSWNSRIQKIDTRMNELAAIHTIVRT